MKRTMSIFAALLISLSAISAPPCKGATKAGKPCASIMVGKDGFCRSHSPNSKRCGHPTAKGTPCAMVVKEGLCRFHINNVKTK